MSSHNPMILHTVFGFGDVVYLRCRADRLAGMVTTVRAVEGSLTYGVTWADTGHESSHYDYELVSEYHPDYHTS